MRAATGYTDAVTRLAALADGQVAAIGPANLTGLDYFSCDPAGVPKKPTTPTNAKWHNAVTEEQAAVLALGNAANHGGLAPSDADNTQMGQIIGPVRALHSAGLDTGVVANVHSRTVIASEFARATGGNAAVIASRGAAGVASVTASNAETLAAACLVGLKNIAVSGPGCSLLSSQSGGVGALALGGTSNFGAGLYADAADLTGEGSMNAYLGIHTSGGIFGSTALFSVFGGIRAGVAVAVSGSHKSVLASDDPTSSGDFNFMAGTDTCTIAGPYTAILAAQDSTVSGGGGAVIAGNQAVVSGLMAGAFASGQVTVTGDTSATLAAQGTAGNKLTVSGANSAIIASTTGAAVDVAQARCAMIASDGAVLPNAGTTNQVYGGTAGACKWRINGLTGDYYGGPYNAGNADFAELYRFTGDLPLRRLVTRTGRVVRLAEPGDRLHGAVSEAPAFVGNSPETGYDPKEYAPIALTGQVLVEVAAPCQDGDFLHAGPEGRGLPMPIPGVCDRRVEVMEVVEAFDGGRGYALVWAIVG